MSLTGNNKTAMSSTHPIGVFDSGVGGLSILSKIHQLMPNEELLYLADSLHAPYGPKDAVFIQQRCIAAMEFFQSKNVKAVVLACNTATAAAVAMLRERYSIPIIGMEPALKPAAQQSRSGVVGVLATEGTIDSDKFLSLHSQYADQVEIITKACPGLVEHIEGCIPDKQAVLDLLKEFTFQFSQKAGDVLVLGCTHYPLIVDLITEVVGDQVNIMDTGFGVANELLRRLKEVGLVGVSRGAGVSFYSTGDIVRQAEVVSYYWGSTVRVFKV